MNTTNSFGLYTPQQNGVVERKKQIIMNMGRTLLIEREMSVKFLLG
jgi:hypothetical protein